MNTVVSYDVVKKRLEASFCTLDIASEIERHTGIRLSCPDSKKQYNGACPYPGCSADTNGFVVWPELTEKGCHYHCRRCGKAGHILNLVIDMKNLKFGDACKELGIPNPYKEEGNETYKSFVKRGPQVEQWQLDELQYLTSIYPRAKLALQRERAKAYLAERGIPLELAVEHGLGYFPALSEVSRVTSELERFRRWCDRLIFPLQTPKGEIGYCGRSLFLWEIGMDEDEHKRRIDAYNLQMQELHGEKAIWHQMPRWKYTYQQGFFNWQAIQEATCPIFVEGPFDVLACLASGIEGAISIGTTGVDASVLPANVYSAIIGLDIDGPGRKAAKQLAKEFRRKGIDVQICTPVDGKDWSAAYRIHGAQGLESLTLTVEPVEREEPVAEPDVLDQFPENCEDCHAAMDVDDRSFFYWGEDVIHCYCNVCRDEQTGLEKTQVTMSYSPTSLPPLPRKMCPCVTVGWNAKGRQTKQTCQSKVADNGFCEQHGLAHEFLEIGAQLGYPEVKVPFKWKQETLHRTIYAGVTSWEEHACTVHSDRADSLKGNIEYLRYYTLTLGS
jgi:hypothetical protein